MDNVCLPTADFHAFLLLMQPVIVKAELIIDYIIVENITHVHAYEEAFGQVCHILGFDKTTGEVLRNSTGINL